MSNSQPSKAACELRKRFLGNIAREVGILQETQGICAEVTVVPRLQHGKCLGVRSR